jgi:hypothetical protein
MFCYLKAHAVGGIVRSIAGVTVAMTDEAEKAG